MSSNLPPGCSSPDGGIDHAWEAAVELLLNDLETADEVIALRKFVPAMREVMRECYDEGMRDAAAEEQEL